MHFHELLSRFHSRSQSARRRPSRSREECRLRLEGLETRWVPTTVTNLNDAGPGSLRQAIADTAPGGTVDFMNGLSGTILLTTMPSLTINKDLTIAGPGPGVITVDAGLRYSVFTIPTSSTPYNVTISGLTITHGQASTGGGINSAGTLNVMDCILTANSASGSGGGIYSSGTLTVSDTDINHDSASAPFPGGGGGGIFVGGNASITGSTFSFDSALLSGGGILDNASGGTVTISNTSMNNNSAQVGGGAVSNLSRFATVNISNSTLAMNLVSGFGDGGAILNYGPMTITASTFTENAGVATGAIDNLGSMTVSNSTFSANSSTGTGQDEGGGAIYAGGGLEVFNSTFTLNTAANKGGGIYVDSAGVGSLLIFDTIVAGDTSTSGAGPDVWGDVDSAGHNLIGDSTSSSGWVASDMLGTAGNPIDPQLEPLGNYGGPTQTHRPMPTSPAVDAGDNAGAPTYDQRGPGFDRIVNGTIDIGAVELQPNERGGSPGAHKPLIHARADLLAVGEIRLENGLLISQIVPETIGSPPQDLATELRFALSVESQRVKGADHDSLDSFLALAQDRYDNIVGFDYAEAINGI